MPAAARQIVGLLDRIARQLRARSIVGADCSQLADLCDSVPQQLSVDDRQELTRQVLICAHFGTTARVGSCAFQTSPGLPTAHCRSLLSLSDAVVATDWAVADETSRIYKDDILLQSFSVVTTCCKLGTSLRLDGTQAAQVCRTASVVLGFGRRALRRLSGQPSAAADALRAIMAQTIAVSSVP